ncbi:MAG: hypothetical protein Q8K57_13445 [Thiobacillus sp.]|nr:hypothetical protein [Thiobacillus sp.]
MTEKAKIVLEAEDRTRAAFASLKNNLSAAERQSVTLSRAMGGIVPALGIGALAAFAKSGIDAADSLNDMSQRLGVSVKDLASFQLSAEQSGTSLDGVGAGIARLTRSIGEAEGGNKKMAQSLADLGITARDPKEAFFQLADAVKTIEDPSKRAALLSDVLGKSYQDLIPLLSQGGEELRKSAKASESFAEAMAKAAPDADKFNDELERLKQEGALVSAVLLNRMVPGLSETAKRVSELLDEDKGVQALVRAIAGLGKLPFDVIFGDIKIAETATDRIKELKTELNDLQGDLKSAQPGGSKSSVMFRALFGKPDEIERQILVIKNQIGALEKFGDKIYKPKKVGDKPSDTIKPPSSGGGGGSKSDPQGAFVAKLRDEAATLGLTGEALKRYEASKLKLTGTNKKLADSYIAQIAAFNDQQAAAKANNDAFDEAVKKQDELDAALEGSIKSVREWIAEQEFEVTLIGLTNSERETAIQMRALETAGIDTQTEAYQRLKEQVEAANSDKRGMSLLAGTQTEKTKEFMSDIDSLNKLFFDGNIGAAQYAEGIDLVTGSADKAAVEMDEFAKNAAKSVQGLFSDFFRNFDKDNDNMLQKFGETVKGLVAEAASAQLTRALFGGLSDGGKTDGNGWIGSALEWMGTIASFDGGGSTGSGSRSGGLDGKGGFLAVMHPNETVTDHTKGQRAGGGTTLVQNFYGYNNAPDVRRAGGQGAREFLGVLSGAQRYS